MVVSFLKRGEKWENILGEKSGFSVVNNGQKRWYKIQMELSRKSLNKFGFQKRGQDRKCRLKTKCCLTMWRHKSRYYCNECGVRTEKDTKCNPGAEHN